MGGAAFAAVQKGLIFMGPGAFTSGQFGKGVAFSKGIALEELAFWPEAA